MQKCCMSGDELILLASSVSIAIAKGQDADTLELLRGLFQAIGQNLSVISTQKNLCCNCENEDT